MAELLIKVITMVDDKDNIIKIEIADELVSKLNIHEILQYYLRQLLEEQLKGKDCAKLQKRFEVVKRAIFREQHRRWLLENNKSFYFENPIVLQTQKEMDN